MSKIIISLSQSSLSKREITEAIETEFAKAFANLEDDAHDSRDSSTRMSLFMLVHSLADKPEAYKKRLLDKINFDGVVTRASIQQDVLKFMEYLRGKASSVKPYVF